MRRWASGGATRSPTYGSPRTCSPRPCAWRRGGWAALEDRCDLALQQGRHRELVRGVRRLVDENPTRERLWALLISALYRSGRGEEAIAAYAEARERLADELGIEPGAALQQLEAGILRNEPEPGARAGSELTPVQPRPRARIPLLSTATFGRDELVTRVAGELSDPEVRLLTLTGIGGSGKSRVATLVASAAEERFTDVVYLQVTEVTPGATAARRGRARARLQAGGRPGGVARGAGGRPSPVASCWTTWRPSSRDLTSYAACSRRPSALDRPGDQQAALWLDGEHVMPVDPLDYPGKAADAATIAASASVQLFVDRARSADPDFRLAGNEHDVARLCYLLDGLPLALELAAARVKLRSLDRIIDGLRDSVDSLSGSDTGPDHHRTLTSAIALELRPPLPRGATGV